MSTNCASIDVDLFLFSCERDSLSQKVKQLPIQPLKPTCQLLAISVLKML